MENRRTDKLRRERESESNRVIVPLKDERVNVLTVMMFALAEDAKSAPSRCYHPGPKRAYNVFSRSDCCEAYLSRHFHCKMIQRGRIEISVNATGNQLR